MSDNSIIPLRVMIFIIAFVFNFLLTRRSGFEINSGSNFICCWTLLFSLWMFIFATAEIFSDSTSCFISLIGFKFSDFVFSSSLLFAFKNSICFRFSISSFSEYAFFRTVFWKSSFGPLLYSTRLLCEI